jgi:hypothetical protein
VFALCFQSENGTVTLKPGGLAYVARLRGSDKVQSGVHPVQLC